MTTTAGRLGHKIVRLTVWGGAVLLTACVHTASGPKYDVAAANFPDIPAGHGRIYLYRPDQGLMRLQGTAAEVTLDGLVIGKAVLGGFFFVDVQPGDHDLVYLGRTTNFMRAQTSPVSIHVREGETQYVEMWVTGTGTSLILNFTAVHPLQGQRNVKDLLYTGPDGGN